MKLTDLRNKFVPFRETKIGADSLKGTFPINTMVQRAIKEKHSLHRKWIRCRGEEKSHLRAVYNKSRSKVKRLIRQSKRSFEKGIAANCKKNPK